jgi:hypothetical protein
MNEKVEFQKVFEQLREILNSFAGDLDLLFDESDTYYLNTKYIMSNNKPMYFGSVKINKNYVSYHLMPVYVFPELLKSISSELEIRMQGKSCFNFKLVNTSVFKELAELTKQGFQQYRNAGYV